MRNVGIDGVVGEFGVVPLRPITLAKGTQSMKRFSLLSLIMMLGLSSLAIAPASAKVGSSNFSGIVNHVSSSNIKVTDNVTHQTLGFTILPKFDQVFSADGKTTYQMSKIKAGQYVKVYYDQKAFGMRHADRIILLTQHNHVKGVQ